jgi:hypothetical protein
VSFLGGFRGVCCLIICGNDNGVRCCCGDEYVVLLRRCAPGMWCAFLLVFGFFPFCCSLRSLLFLWSRAELPRAYCFQPEPGFDEERARSWGLAQQLRGTKACRLCCKFVASDVFSLYFPSRGFCILLDDTLFQILVHVVPFLP